MYEPWNMYFVIRIQEQNEPCPELVAASISIGPSSPDFADDDAVGPNAQRFVNEHACSPPRASRLPGTPMVDAPGQYLVELQLGILRLITIRSRSGIEPRTHCTKVVLPLRVALVTMMLTGASNRGEALAHGAVDGSTFRWSSSERAWIRRMRIIRRGGLGSGRLIHRTVQAKSALE